MWKAFPELAMLEELPVLDVEPPQAETPPRASMHDSQLAILYGAKELVLFPPSAQLGEELSSGYEVSGLRAKALRAVLQTGDLLYVPSGWWVWSRTITAVITARHSVQSGQQGGQWCSKQCAQAAAHNFAAKCRGQGVLHSCSVVSRRTKWASCKHHLKAVD
ncbi:unnamed protein product [Symbiodinium pilosum]|uniref:JmjC domain-containing protein n=1 Tax=Symbiodinium pilosum TaxID=2952 RepID=A0A812U9R3_SYMPI|nr:unnamed protein product [Symbiodinium pilosum]